MPTLTSSLLTLTALVIFTVTARVSNDPLPTPDHHNYSQLTNHSADLFSELDTMPSYTYNHITRVCPDSSYQASIGPSPTAILTLLSSVCILLMLAAQTYFRVPRPTGSPSLRQATKFRPPWRVRWMRRKSRAFHPWRVAHEKWMTRSTPCTQLCTTHLAPLHQRGATRDAHTTHAARPAPSSNLPAAVLLLLLHQLLLTLAARPNAQRTMQQMGLQAIAVGGVAVAGLVSVNSQRAVPGPPPPARPPRHASLRCTALQAVTSVVQSERCAHPVARRSALDAHPLRHPIRLDTTPKRAPRHSQAR